MTNDPKNIKISDYDYPLPDGRIAKFPLEQRDQSKLLVYDHGEISHSRFFNLPELLPEGSLMVFNNTRVIRARLHFRKETGALIEVFLLEPHSPADYERMFQMQGGCEWLCLIGNLKKWKEGVLRRMFVVNGEDTELSAEHIGTQGTSHVVRLSWTGGASFADVIDAAGELPIPPYLNRDTQESDLTTYQTVYSKIKGSVAAPTAGLHFTDKVLENIDSRGIEREELTLHVGAGTFRPVKSALISGHDMHTEYVSVRLHTIERLIAHGCRAIAVGTTSVRTLESLYYIGCHILKHKDCVTDKDLHVCQWEPYEAREKVSAISSMDAVTAIRDYLAGNGMEVLNASTQIIIAPGYKYHIVSHLVTNFHQPQSTLLLLVSALVGEDWRRIYDYALDNDFRFLSYGDSSLLIPDGE
ncbi:MAG: S-adenosylmethionine:tRNA ribosyltransferase-isomerase [Bacteroidales bacterium]|nr:S-adenosylmethionine:tRNA ribosyltransferase-isomerase [Bacteroidales bacterium]MCM1147824.1 S-adenosylmethionine:tRNA ribosyltransferase-isomerase [Bacteroidales bacterium]MCM1206472.1 S-adenosylmethionine:tRNA ribosyltransferase-isomerase [Bacillota bacterium]MCM1510357.1 S-adenosylmethionine:tRNA ribosyltransferase-isomerase [Clostridium sp.]